MGSLTPAKLRHALALLALAESPIVLQVLHLDRSDLFFVFSLAWAIGLYTFIEPPRRSIGFGLFVYVFTAAVAVPLLLAWLGPERAFSPDEHLSHQLWTFVFGVGVREELCKAAALVVLLGCGRALQLKFTSREGMLYGAMSGLAFAAAENLEALRRLSHLEEVTLAHGIPQNSTVAVALTRLALTPLAHACWTGAVGYACTVAVRSGWQRPLLALLALTSVALLHGLYDEAATTANGIGVGLILALSFLLTLYLISRPPDVREPAVAHT